MMVFRYSLLALWLLTGAVMASDTTVITLVNGITMTGQVTAVTADGLELRVGRSSRVYPWPTLAPGTRFRYDALYRMNVAAMLEGELDPARLNPPDPHYNPMNPDASLSGIGVSPEMPSTFSLAAFDPSGPFAPSAIRALRGLPATNAVFIGYQYGPDTNHAVVFGFADESPERLAAWNAANNRTASLTARDASFPEQRYSAAWGEANLQTAFAWSGASTGRSLTARIVWSDGPREEAFVLYDQPALFVSGGQPVHVRPLLDDPQIEWIARQDEAGQWRLAGRIRMGRLTWYPDAGSTAAVAVQLRSGNRTVASPALAYAADPGVRYPLQLALEANVKPGDYQITASVNLGAFLGTLKHEHAFTIRPAPGTPQP